jgi:hypothetical protein
LFFLRLETRRVSLAGITRHPTEEWMTQMARNAVDEESGYLRRHRYVLRCVRSVKSECLSHFILVGEGSLRRALKNFCEHYHSERNHQGKGNVLLFPGVEELPKRRESSIDCRERLGGLLKYYYRRAA